MKFCPLMSYTNQKAECQVDCALWRHSDAKGGQCGLLGVSDQVADGFEQLVMTIREIKVRL